MVTDVTTDEFPSFIDSDKPVVIDFWAPWCGPCKNMKPEYEAFADTYGQKIRAGKVNVDDYPEIAQVYSLYSVPTVAVFLNGELAHISVGAKTADQLSEELGEWIRG